MSAGMAEVIAAHNGYDTHWESRDGDQIWYTVCDGCDWRQNLENAPADDHAAHVAEELTKAGFGNMPAALMAAADEMPIETLGGADKASIWLRHRAHSQDPEGHSLVKAIHDRKAETNG